MIMKFELNEWGQVVFDVGSVHIWVTSGMGDDPHPPGGGRVAAGDDEIILELTRENVEVLIKALQETITRYDADPDGYSTEKVPFVKPA